MKELFNTKEEIDSAASSFRVLKNDAGWKLLVDIVKANMDILKEQILNGFEDETKETIDRKRDKLKAYEEVISTPDEFIKRSETHETFREDEDPYHTVETLRKSRNK
jgi:hypothetical protein